MRAKIQKGDPGYIQHKRSRFLMYAVLMFTVAAILLVIGLTRTGSRMNVYTIVAVLACLPACYELTEYIAMFRLRSIDPDTFKEIRDKTTHLVTAYDLVLTVKEKLMPVDVLVFYGHVICGYKTSEKTDEAEVSAYLKQMLADNKYDKMTVKIFTDYQAFLRRVDELENNSEAEGLEKHAREEELKELVLACSM